MIIGSTKTVLGQNTLIVFFQRKISWQTVKVSWMGKKAADGKNTAWGVWASRFWFREVSKIKYASSPFLRKGRNLLIEIPLVLCPARPAQRPKHARETQNVLLIHTPLSSYCSGSSLLPGPAAVVLLGNRAAITLSSPVAPPFFAAENKQVHLFISSGEM